ncbi:unnamed protein product [Amoebophrya sp. A120]|nr:unnamed protein product [Amoebophrya sp. A120]|eukprot:GSA120T00011034001.1
MGGKHNKGKGKGNKKGGGKPATPAPVAPELVVLHNLAKEGKLQEMVDHGMTHINLLYNDHIARVPLHLAAYYGHVEIVDKILEICPEAADRQAQDAFLPAHFAAQQGHLECLRSLVKVAGTTQDGEMRVGGVKKLMQRLVKLDRNMLHLACAKQHVETALYLIDKGCDLFAKNAHGKSPFELLDDEHRSSLQAKLREIEESKKAKQEGNPDAHPDAHNPQHTKPKPNATATRAAAALAGATVAAAEISQKEKAAAASSSSRPEDDTEGPQEAAATTSASPRLEPQTLKRPKEKLATTAEDMEAKLARMLGGGGGAPKPAKAPKIAKTADDMEAKLAALMAGGEAGKSGGSTTSQVQPAAPAAPPKKAGFSLDDVLKNSYD